MKRIATFAAALALAGCAHQPPSADAPASLAAAETAFAAHSVREDMRVAFLAAFADDGLLVRNAWVVAKTWLAARPAPAIVLDWRPQYVEVAASGELGLSTGPWKLTSKEKPDAPAAFGQFVSIWRRGGQAARRLRNLWRGGPALLPKRQRAPREPRGGAVVAGDEG